MFHSIVFISGPCASRPAPYSFPLRFSGRGGEETDVRLPPPRRLPNPHVGPARSRRSSVPRPHFSVSRTNPAFCPSDRLFCRHSVRLSVCSHTSPGRHRATTGRPHAPTAPIAIGPSLAPSDRPRNAPPRLRTGSDRCGQPPVRCAASPQSPVSYCDPSPHRKGKVRSAAFRRRTEAADSRSSLPVLGTQAAPHGLRYTRPDARTSGHRIRNTHPGTHEVRGEAAPCGSVDANRPTQAPDFESR